LPGKTPDLLASLNERIARMDSSYRPDKPFVKVKFHDFSQTTLEQAGAGRDLESYRQLLSQAFARRQAGALAGRRGEVA
jgi:DNA polymerase-4